ncbi:AfsA/ScbA [Streptomyces globisporus]|uniref:AfsA/ScbA n=1 Tax=Streptomyces globisporus TaxID=1908 RepID=A0A423USH2_STRGL|nr:AfsA/ScbA [Streptomyces globisporus]
MHQWQVHKLQGEEVLLRTWTEGDSGRFVLTARWPKGHAFYQPSQGAYDPLLLAETVRQTVPLLSHAVHGVPGGVPREHKQAWECLDFAVEPLAALVTTAEDEVRLVVSCSDVVRRGNRFAGMTMDIDVHLGKRLMGIAHTRFNDQPAAVYRRMRRGYADIDVALENRLETAHPGVDTAHPVLFDHPVDHAPGMLLLEAARQAARAVGGATAAVIGMRTNFVRYVELDAPAVVVAGSPAPVGTGRRRVPVSIEQDGVQVFTSEVTIAG